MKSRIWQLAGVGLLCISVTAQSLADEPQNRGPDGGQHGSDGHQGNNQGHGGNNNQQQGNQPRPQNGQQQNPPHAQNNDGMRGGNSRQFEHNGQNQNGGQFQNRPPPDFNNPIRSPPPPPQLPANDLPIQNGRQSDFNNPVRSPPPPPQLPANDLPIQGRPDSVRQTRPAQPGYYQDVPRGNNYNQHWQTGGPGSRPNDNRWLGRPSGHGNGWGPGPQYRPGHVIDRFPERDDRVPYGGRDYFFSGGYWYRPQGPRYVVVQPPRGIRVSYLPDYAREVWIGSSLLFLAAGSYYAYQQDTQDYEVVEPPGQPLPQSTSDGYDVEAYPSNGQSPEQVNQDGYDCYRYAVEQSGFDPRADTYQPDPSVVQAYRQAQGDCLGSRGYRVNY